MDQQNLKDQPLAPQDMKSESLLFFFNSTGLYVLTKKEVAHNLWTNWSLPFIISITLTSLSSVLSYFSLAQERYVIASFSSLKFLFPQ